MHFNFLIFLGVISISFVTDATSKQIALTGSKPQNSSPIRTSVSRYTKTHSTDYSLIVAPEPTSPPHRSGFRLAKRQSNIQSCGNYQIPGFNLQLMNGQACMVDENALMFGACSTAITDPRDCGWAEVCVDRHACTSSCGRISVPNLSITTCGSNGNDYCAMWYIISDTYIYTSITCSDTQSWSSFDAILVTTLSEDLTDQNSQLTPTPTSTSALLTTQTGPSTLTISVGRPGSTGNDTLNPDVQNSGRSLGTIMGAVFGSLGAVALMGFVLWFCHRRMQSKKRAERALAYDPANTSSDDHVSTNILGSPYTGSAPHPTGSGQLTGGPAQVHEMNFMDSPLGSPNIEDGSIHQGGIRNPKLMSPIPAPSVHSMRTDPPVYEMHSDQARYEMHADTNRPIELPA